MRKLIFLVSIMLVITSIAGCSSYDNENVSAQNGISSTENTTTADNTNESAVSAAKEEKSSSESSNTTISDSSDNNDGEVEIDLTQLSSSMIYAQVYDMVYNGDNYLGKKVKVKGPFSYFQETDGREFFAVLVSDATACCSQGIEFVLDGEHTYPNDYPELGTEITVTGEFDYYTEGYATYCQLLHAEMEVDKSLSWN